MKIHFSFFISGAGSFFCDFVPFVVCRKTPATTPAITGFFTISISVIYLSYTNTKVA